MDDKFLFDMRVEPSRAFASRLRERLKAEAGAAPAERHSRFSMRRLAYAAASIAAIGLLFALPPVRASAQAFLDLFRVVNFTAVPVSPDRIKALNSDSINLERLIGEQVQILVDPGQPQTFQSRDAASAAAGFRVRLPTNLRTGLKLNPTIELSGERAARVTGNTTKLRHVLEALDIDDVTVPQELDGQTATVRMAPMAHVTIQFGDQRVDFIQGPSPVVTLPAGVDLAMLGEIGLRILGLSAGEARRLAQSVDWHSTLPVAVPANATSFRQVDVRGNRGLMIEMTPPPREGDKRPRYLTSLMWSEGGHVYALRGPVRPEVMLEMATSLD